MSTGEHDTIAEEAAEAPVENSSTNRKQPFPRGFLETISTGWAERPETVPQPRAQAPFAAKRRAAADLPLAMPPMSATVKGCIASLLRSAARVPVSARA